ncbi:MAG: ATP-dependent Clp endopeptidase proteolytic subunit ClpP [Alistipes sp.]|nr:ATP-dependent Clp endopeptidase proteolytic subunit ClpP [Alistipes sp.]
MSEFEKYAKGYCGISSLKLHDFKSIQSAYVSPTIIEERQLNVATMDVFSRLMMDRIIFLGAPIYDDAANIIQAQLLFLESVDPSKDIQIYINSPGGSVSAGLGIYDTMQLISSDVATICTGLAASMGAVLLTAGAAGKRSALPHSRIMIHQPLGGAQGQASDIEITAREIMKTKKELYEILSHHSGVSVEKIERDADRDYWMTSAEAKEYGLIDAVLGKRTK